MPGVAWRHQGAGGGDWVARGGLARLAKAAGGSEGLAFERRQAPRDPPARPDEKPPPFETEGPPAQRGVGPRDQRRGRVRKGMATRGRRESAMGLGPLIARPD